MKKRVELPLASPTYSTYHFQGPNDSLYPNNESMKNWCLNEIMNLCCNRRFLFGYSTPEVGIEKSSWHDNPFIERITYPMDYCGGYINYIIKNLIDAKYYVFYWGADDYYMDGKTWYKTRHFNHDGLICGYDSFEEALCLCAYDVNWVYRKFWVPIKSFDKGIKATQENEGYYGQICGIKPKSYTVDFSSDLALNNIKKYLESTLEEYPENETDDVYGHIVHYYVARYLEKLIDKSIPYERVDRRVFRMLWEHKRSMLERIRRIEKDRSLGTIYSTEYQTVVDKLNFARILFASHVEKRRDSLLPTIKNALLTGAETESSVLRSLLEDTGIQKSENVI